MILVGHAHVEIPERVVTNEVTGKEVVLSEPLKWGQRLSQFDFSLSYAHGRWSVTSVDATVHNTNTVPEDPRIVRLLAASHDTVVDYVNSVTGTATQAMSAATARSEDTAALDFINYVQAEAVKGELTGADAALPVLSIAAPFNRGAVQPGRRHPRRRRVDPGHRRPVHLRQHPAGHQAHRRPGQGLSREVRRVLHVGPRGGTYAAEDLTNTPTATAPNGTPDYNDDVMAGLDQPLTHDIDLSQDQGSRITDLAYGGVPVADDEQFVVAINNYRQSGGGNFPHVTTAPVVYNQQVEIRQLLIDWVTAHQVVDPATFWKTNPDWRLTVGTELITITP